MLEKIPKRNLNQHVEELCSLFQEGQIERVLLEVEPLLGKFSKSIALYNIKGISCAHLKRFDEAIKSYKLKLIPIPTKILHKEVYKIFTRCEKPSKVFDSWRRTDILTEIFPELDYCINIDQSQKKDKLDLYQHIMYALDSVPLSQQNHLVTKLLINSM
mgnify:CR=1 FL=1